MTATGFEGVRLEIKIEEPSGRRRPDAAITLDGAQRRTPRPTLLGRALLIAALAVCIGSRGAVSYSALLVTLVLAGAASSSAPCRRPRRPGLAGRCTRRSSWPSLSSPMSSSSPGASRQSVRQSALVGRRPSGRADRRRGIGRSGRDAGCGFLLILPFVFYGAGLSLYQTDEGALKLLTWLGPSVWRSPSSASRRWRSFRTACS